jgi:uncharacterized membrane protein YeiH
VPAALAVWIVGPRPRLFGALLWFDALGLAAYAIVGAAKAANYGVPPVVCVVMGALTASFGGVIRDVLAGEPSVLLRREITISAGLMAAGVFVTLRWLGLEPWVAALVGFAAGFSLRGGALLWGWSLPPFRERPADPAAAAGESSHPLKSGVEP